MAKRVINLKFGLYQKDDSCWNAFSEIIKTSTLKITAADASEILIPIYRSVQCGVTW
jgi:hypothetical protein